VAIRALCIVKNEIDVVGEALRAASCWCDRIYVFDNGSSDGTWECVQELARELPAIVPFKQDSKPFTDSLRGEILRCYQREAGAGDWWCILDADEFYVDDPRAFLAQVPDRYRAVWPQRYTYLFTDSDAQSFREDPRRYAPNTPITQRLRHYVLGEYSELRFFRHDPRFTAVPVHLQPIFPQRIRLGHYAYRSPEQITVRLETRMEPMQRGEFVHEKRSNWLPDGHAAEGPATSADVPRGWEERIVPHTECNFDGGDHTLLAPLDWTPPEPGPAMHRGRPGPIKRRLMQFAKRLALAPTMSREPIEPTPH
jgi:hypothetical protein